MIKICPRQPNIRLGVPTITGVRGIYSADMPIVPSNPSVKAVRVYRQTAFGGWGVYGCGAVNILACVQ